MRTSGHVLFLGFCYLSVIALSGQSGVGGWLVTTMLHKQTPNPAIYGVFACLHKCRRMFDVQQHEAQSQVFLTFANLPKTLLFAG